MATDTQTMTSVTEPWAPQQSYLKDIFAEAQKNYRSEGPFPYPGQQIIGFTPQETQAQRMTEQYALGPALQQTQNQQNAQAFTLGPVLYPQSNPALQQHAAGAIRPIANTLMEQVLPTLDQGAVLSGAYGGSRHGIAQGLAVDRAVQDMLDTTSKIYSNAYGQGLGALVAGLQAAPTTLQSGTIPMQQLAATGVMDRELAQALLNEDIANWNFTQSLPSVKLAEYQGLVQGMYGGNYTGSQQVPQPNKFLSGLGGAMSGFSLGSMLGNTSFGSSLGGAGVLGPIGAGIGLLGSLFG